MDDENFLQETIEKIRSVGKSSADIDFVGLENLDIYCNSDNDFVCKFVCDWEEFEQISEFEYRRGFWSVEILDTLVVVFKDGSWLSRANYDGDESWQYNRSPVKAKDAEKLIRVKHKSGF